MYYIKSNGFDSYPPTFPKAELNVAISVKTLVFIQKIRSALIFCGSDSKEKTHCALLPWIGHFQNQRGRDTIFM